MDPRMDICRWFLHCTNPATWTVPHPILVRVAVCDSCKAWVEANR